MAHQLSDRRAVILDDHTLFAKGMQLMLKNHFGFSQVSTFSSVTASYNFIKQHADSVALMMFDYYIPGEDVVPLVADIKEKYENIKLVCVSASQSVADKKKVMEAGALVFINKAAPPDQLLDILERLLKNQSIEEPEAHAQPVLDLTARQSQILILLAQGHSNKEIARLLEISPETVKSHVADLLRKTETQNRMQIVAWARARGFSSEH